MHESREQRILRILSGADRSVPAAAARASLAIAEPIYAAAMHTRKWLYDIGVLKSHKLLRPTISVGNITTGGTGKTPMVRWLAQRLVESRLRPAILLRGYRGGASGGGDEKRLLSDALGDRGDVIANPNRGAGAMKAMSQMPQPDVFILDDGFQHRRARRDFDLVLINATQPFGFNHVLPRGLLREPLRGLRRADAIVITRADQADAAAIDSIERRIRAHATDVPIYHARHVHTGLRAADGQILPLDELSRRRFFLFCGIADPGSLRRQLEPFGENFVGMRVFDDHFNYTDDSVKSLQQTMSQANADTMVTTEKDWVKLDPATRAALPILTLDLQIEFRGGDEDKLLKQIMDKIGGASAAASPAAWR